MDERFNDEDGDIATMTSYQRGAADDSGEQWAVKVDIKTPVDDFYKRIPDMAYKVHIQDNCLCILVRLHVSNVEIK